MPEGRVAAWAPHKGVGIVESDDGKQAFIHHTQITTPGFKNLEEGQRVRYDLKSDPRGAQAVNVAPLPLFEMEVSPEEWNRIETLCARKKIDAKVRHTEDPWKRPRMMVLVGLSDRESLIDEIHNLQPDLKKEQPKNPVFIVDFQYDEGSQGGWCAVGAGTPREAETLAASRLKELLPDGVVDGGIVESMPLEEYEQESGRVLPQDSFPRPGEVVPIG
jgi:CspA family cold shock protein